MPLLVVHDPGHKGGIDGHLGRNSLHPAMSEAVLAVVPIEVSFLSHSHLLTFPVGHRSICDRDGEKSISDGEFLSYTVKRMPDSALARRMFAALNAFEERRGSRVTLAVLGELVADAMPGRETPYAASVAARWVKGEQDPGSRDQWLALAGVLGVDPGWLTYGTGAMTAKEGQSAPIVLDPTLPTGGLPPEYFDQSKSRKLTPAGLEAVQAAQKAEKAKQGTKRRKAG